MNGYVILSINWMKERDVNRNSGPGGSSMMGLFEESGPCMINPDNKTTTFNPSNWAEAAHVIYLEYAYPFYISISYSRHLKIGD